MLNRGNSTRKPPAAMDSLLVLTKRLQTKRRVIDRGFSFRAGSNGGTAARTVGPLELWFVPLVRVFKCLMTSRTRAVANTHYVDVIGDPDVADAGRSSDSVQVQALCRFALNRPTVRSALGKRMAKLQVISDCDVRMEHK